MNGFTVMAGSSVSNDMPGFGNMAMFYSLGSIGEPFVWTGVVIMAQIACSKLYFVGLQTHIITKTKNMKF